MSGLPDMSAWKTGAGGMRINRPADIGQGVLVALNGAVRAERTGGTTSSVSMALVEGIMRVSRLFVFRVPEICLYTQLALM